MKNQPEVTSTISVTSLTLRSLGFRGVPTCWGVDGECIIFMSLILFLLEMALSVSKLSLDWFQIFSKVLRKGKVSHSRFTTIFYKFILISIQKFIFFYKKNLYKR